MSTAEHRQSTHRSSDSTGLPFPGLARRPSGLLSESTALKKLLQPGMRLKRWLGLVLLGLVITGLGITYLLIDLYRTAPFPGWVELLTLQFMPQWGRAVLFLGVGVGTCYAGAYGLYRSASEVVMLSGAGRLSLIDLIYNTRLRHGGPRIVCVGGGTGMPSVLRGLKPYSDNITAVVTVGDDGGSSGRLRREHGILPPGDFRNNIVALAEVEPLMARLFQHRFSNGGSLEGHSFGNLFVLAMTAITGNFEQAIRETSRVLAVKGTILPSTVEEVTIHARFEDGTEVAGESQVPEVGKRIDRVYLEPEHPAAQPEAVRAILEADLVILGPGSLYTSVLPNLLVEGIAKAIQGTDALIVYVCNVATQPGETDGYDVDDHVKALVKHLPGERNPIDFVLVYLTDPDLTGATNEVHLVRARGDRVGADGPRIIRYDLVREDQPWRHDSEKLGLALLDLYDRYRPRASSGIR